MTTKITAPDARFTGPTYIGPTILDFREGVASTDVKLQPGTLRYLEKCGYKVDDGDADDDGPFDPSKHTVEEVLAYLGGSDEDHPPVTAEEWDRVKAAEAAGKARKGILEHEAAQVGEDE